MAANHKDQAGAELPDADGRPAAPPYDLPELVPEPDTLPPTPFKALLASSKATVYVLSADRALIDVVRRAAAEQYPVIPIEHWDELESAVRSGQGGVALLDDDLLGASLTPQLKTLAPYANRLVILLAAERSVAQGLMGLLSERKVHRLLIKPPAPGITRLLLESAIKRYMQLREAAVTQLGLEPVESEPSALRSSARVPAWVLVTAGAALVAGVAAILQVTEWRQGAPAEETADAGATVTTAAPSAPAVESGPGESEPGQSEPSETTALEAPAPGVIADTPPTPRFDVLLASAEEAFRQGRLAAPPGDNALDYYLAILAADPAEPTARAQIRLVTDALFAQAEAALLVEDQNAAAVALMNARRAEPESARLMFLEAQLERLQAALTAPRPAAGVAGAEFSSLITIARARFDRGQLLTPAGDSASAYLDRAAQLEPDNAEVVALRNELSAALVVAARGAITRSATDDAAGFARAARRYGANGAAVTALDNDIAAQRAAQAAEQHDAWLASARSNIETGLLLAPENDNALYWLEQLQSEAPEHAGLGDAWAAWRTAMTADVRRAIEARDWDGAANRLAVLESAPQGAAAAAPLVTELDFARRQAEFLATAAPASELTVIVPMRPIYPYEAESRGVEGWVDVEFVVDTTGRPKDLVVTGSQPRGPFEEEALAAVQRSRYAPFELDGRIYERRARLRVTFRIR